MIQSQYISITSVLSLKTRQALCGGGPKEGQRLGGAARSQEVHAEGPDEAVAFFLGKTMMDFWSIHTWLL